LWPSAYAGIVKAYFGVLDTLSHSVIVLDVRSQPFMSPKDYPNGYSFHGQKGRLAGLVWMDGTLARAIPLVKVHPDAFPFITAS
jgi:hypothetical protein